MKKIISLVLLTTMISGCTPPPPGAGQQTGGIAKQDIGTILGGVGGGVIGSTMGKGNGRIATTVAGALLGGFLGNSVGKSLDQADAAYANQTAQRALETAPVGQPLPWQNPQSGNSGEITPQAYYRTQDGGYCREYSQKIMVGGKTQSGYGKACRQPDGSWKIVE